MKHIPAQFVRPYVKSNKNDAADAEAICDAVQRPRMGFAAPKDLDVQSMPELRRSRRLPIKQCTQTTNSLRARCAEFGVIALQNSLRHMADYMSLKTIKRQLKLPILT